MFFFQTETFTFCCVTSLSLLPASLKKKPAASAAAGPAFDGVAAALATVRASPLADDSTRTVDAFAAAAIIEEGLEEPFYVVDLGVVVRRYLGWVSTMPRVTPFYAVKCCPDPAFIAILASLGAGFDVASMKELQMVAAAGVGSGNPAAGAAGAGSLAERVIYANPCKMRSHLSFAACSGVTMTTFDSTDELEKIAAVAPRAAAVLRIKADDPNARCSFGHKFGALLSEVPELLRVGQRLGLDMAGVSFHIGSGGASDPTWLCHAVVAARQVFDVAAEMGITMRLLDIGGGFSGGIGALEKVALGPNGLNATIERLFPAAEGVRVIAEPGRYFAEATATLACNVYGRRRRHDEEGPTLDYWISDGVYGSMNCILYDHAVLSTRPLADPSRYGAPDGAGADPAIADAFEGAPLIKSTVFGPTCDGLDTLLRGAPLPELQCGDWLLFPSMGAYTWSAGSNFNGFGRGEKAGGGSTIKCYYVYSSEAVPAAEAAAGDAAAALPLTASMTAAGDGGFRLVEEVAAESVAAVGGSTAGRRSSAALPDTPEQSEFSEMSGDEAELAAMATGSPTWD